MDEYTEVDEDLFPTPILHRASTWAFIFAGVVALALVGWWAKVQYSTKQIEGLIASRQYDAAWSAIGSTRGISDCGRQALVTDLAMLDERTDSLLLRTADSFRTCNPDRHILFGLTARGNLRIAAHAKGLDSAAAWKLHSNAYQAALECVKADSNSVNCAIDGYLALGGMKNPGGQFSWIQNALAKWPKDSAIQALHKDAVRADSLVKATKTNTAPSTDSAAPAAAKTRKKK